MTNDDDLRQLFNDATSEIRPHRTLDDIRSQTQKVNPMTRRWILPSLAAAAAMTLVIGGAYWLTRDTATSDPDSTIAAAPSPTPSGEPAQTVTQSVPIYYLGDGARGPRLFREVRPLQAQSQSAIGIDAANEAISGTPIDGDYRTEWPQAQVEGINVDGVGDTGTFTVTFTDDSDLNRPSGMSGAEAQRSIDALVRTIQGAYGARAGVEFSAAGEPLTELLGVPVSPTEPQTGGSDDEVLALVSISDLIDGATVEPGKLTVTGFAAAFEANVGWEILVGGDAVVDSGFATAEECCTLAPFTFTTNISLEGPGTYTLVVHDSDESGLNRPVNQDTKEIVVR